MLLIIQMLGRSFPFFFASLFKNEQARQESRWEGAFEERPWGNSTQPGWSTARDSTNQKPGQSRQEFMSEQNTEEPSCKPAA
jgi:hypothetical protein